MTIIQHSTPKQDNFFMPAESHPHEAVWLIWPENDEIWRAKGRFAQHAFIAVALQIAQTTPVYFIVSQKSFTEARQRLPAYIKLVCFDNNDAWLRDTGPTYLLNATGQKRAVDWPFNAWGGPLDGMLTDWTKDDAIAAQLANYYHTDYYRAPLILEGGAIHVDGEGTCFTTEECLLHQNRNPELTKGEIEQLLKQYLNVDAVIWLPKGLFMDLDTNGHIDNILHVIKPGEVMLSWCDDPNDPQFSISRNAENALLNQCDAQGRNIKIHRLPVPPPLFISPEEAKSFDKNIHESRFEGARLAASYTNFLITNGQIIYPLLDPSTDDIAYQILKNAFPDYHIQGIESREILLGGGNIHCITQQIPQSVPMAI